MWERAGWLLVGRADRHVHPWRVTAIHSATMHCLSMSEYEIRVRGKVDRWLVAAIGELELDDREATTVLRGSLADDGALRTTLASLHALGLELLDVRRLDHGRAS